MSEQSPEALFDELRAQLEPDINEAITRLVMAYDDLHREAHKIYPDHHNDENIWVTEHSPHLRGETRYRHGVALNEPGEIFLIPPNNLKKPIYKAWLFLHPSYFSDETVLQDGLVIATSLEEFCRQARQGHAWFEVKH